LAKVTRVFAALCVLVALSASASASPKKRELPDYDGRGGSATTTGDVLLWVPRVVLFPLYVVSEYVIRRPLGWMISGAERAHLPAALYDFFAFGPDHKAGFVPVAFLDFGFRPSVGIYAFWKDAGVAGNDLSLHVSTGGSNWFVGTFDERVRFGGSNQFVVGASVGRRPDYLFYAMGPSSSDRTRARYGADIVDLRAGFQIPLWRSSSLETGIGLRTAAFRPGDYRGQTTVDERVAAGVYDDPPGYRTGYEAFLSKIRLVLDTRRAQATGRSGVRVEWQSEQGTDLKQDATSGWIRYGGTIGGALDLGNNGRVVSLSVATSFADPLGPRPVPFTELPTLGGAGLMPGFRTGRLRDRSFAVATLHYAWPVWIWLNGSLQAAVGNVFGEHLRGLDLADMRLSAAIGLESEGTSDNTLQILCGLGTRPFAEGGQIDSVRLTLGVRNGL
jgi:hypothetical protein